MKHIFRLLVAVLFFSASPSPLFAQWVQTNGPYGGTVHTFAVSPAGAGGTNLFAGTFGGGVFLSTNDGTTSTEVNTGLTSPIVSSFAVSPDLSGNLFAGTFGGSVWRHPGHVPLLVETPKAIGGWQLIHYAAC